MWSGTFRARPDSARHEIAADWYFTDRRRGESRGEFESLNLAVHVGDDPGAVATNRRQLARDVGVDATALAVIAAEHGARVHKITEDTLGAVPVGDGLITTTPNIALVALAADCAPVVLADIENQVVGVMHCGWRGVVAGIIPATIDKMVEAGAEARSIAAVVGPAICSDCYVVDSSCAQQVGRVSLGAASQYADGQWHVDVAGAVCQSLVSLGVRVERIAECTFTNADLFSYRRDHTTGRHSATIVLRLPVGAA